MIPESRNLCSPKSIEDYLYNRFFRCTAPFLSWMERGQAYWFEYNGNGIYTVRSDNALGIVFKMTEHQLLTCFYPVDIEEDNVKAMKHFHWLGELGIHHGYVDDMLNLIQKQSWR